MSRPSIRWTTEQLDQYEALGRQLQQTHARAAQALIRLARLHPRQMQYERVCSELVDVVHLINQLIAACQTIKARGIEPKFSKVNLIYGNVCDFCLANPKSRDDEKSLEPDPAWGIQVETLLGLTTLTSLHNVEQRCSSPHTFKKSSRCLADLNKTLLREQRHLQSLEKWPVPTLNVIHDFKPICDVCGHRVGDTPPTGTEHAVDLSSSQNLEGSP